VRGRTTCDDSVGGEMLEGPKGDEQAATIVYSPKLGAVQRLVAEKGGGYRNLEKGDTEILVKRKTNEGNFSKPRPPPEVAEKKGGVLQ